MEGITWILIFSLLVAIIVAFQSNYRAKELLNSIASKFEESSYKDKKIKLKELNKKICHLISNLQTQKEKAEFNLCIAENRILELEKAISIKDDIYESLKNKSNESITKITSLYADFMFVQYEVSAKYLETKKRPAVVEAQRIRELKAQSAIHKEQYRQMLYKYEELLQLFPELSDFVDDFATIQQLENAKTLQNLKEDFDRVKYYIDREEYEMLSTNERNQLALDRYLRSRKSRWQIGRDYELFCGQEYEKKGWDVEYIGMEKKLEDLGRDLIAKKDNRVHIIQCKYWSQHRIIHEKHIAQLYGTTVVYDIENNYDDLFKKEVTPVFITNVDLSETAKKFCKRLGVLLLKIKLKEFPRIKCNINGFNKIYHLPFDQQYDRTQIKNEGEFYAFTVNEAVKKGFRRAFKHYPN